VSADAAVAALERQRTRLESELEKLKERKDSMPEAEYQAELERLLVQLGASHSKSELDLSVRVFGRSDRSTVLSFSFCSRSFLVATSPHRDLLRSHNGGTERERSERPNDPNAPND